MKLSELKSDSRGNFNKTWIMEMPSGSGSFSTFDTLEYTIKDFLKFGIEPEKLEADLKRIISDDKQFYWIEDNGVIVLASELYLRPEGLVVSLTGKNLNYKGRGPFASELYQKILKHSDKSIRILSDTQLSDEGLSLWKKMQSLGCKISVYDKNEPGKTFKTFDSADELDAFFRHDDTDFMRYQYVLSENTLDFCTLRASFRLRYHREKSGLSLV